MNSDFLQAYDYLAKNHSKSASDIYYSLELFLNSLDYGIGALIEENKKLMNSQKFSEALELIKYCTALKQIQDTANEYLNEFANNALINEPCPDDKDKEDFDEKVIPNYKDYEVDDEIPHLLSEEFTHKKICAFTLNGIRYNVSSWQDALLSLCNLLSKNEQGKNKLIEFTNSKDFKGSKINYFGTTFIEKKNCKLDNVNIYVWINLSTKMICTLIRKILRQFSININSFYIYLRADYSPLHNNDENEEKDTEKEKIGKYVRRCMRDLSLNYYCFSQETLAALSDKTMTKELIGINLPLLRKCSDNIDISAQAKDSKGRSRYWNEVFTFNGNKYLITSQWFDYNREGFDKWYNNLK